MPLLLLSLLACADKADDTASPVVDTHPCADVPLVNWDNFGQGFITHMCQGCHASTTADRYGAPEAVAFDTVDQVWTLQERVLARVVDDLNMPPAGGVSDDDLVRLQWWLECADPGT